MASPLLRTKSLASLQGDESGHGSGLKRVLGPVQLTALGIGAIIGTGIFVLTGTAAAGTFDPATGEILRAGAGPAIVLSFIVTGIACALAALCYAEFASMIPVSGSAYTYAYASFGELMAWIIGWDLILEYAVGNIAVAIGWSGYFVQFLDRFGVHFPDWLAFDPMTVHNMAATVSQPDVAARGAGILANAPHIGSLPILMNLPAMLIVFLVTALLVYGVKESARLNTGLVFLKLGLIALFIIVGVQYVDFDANWAGTVTLPTGDAGVMETVSKFNPSGWSGIMTGAALIFFAYIGFDAVSTTAEEAKNPKRDLPIGMIASLVICTILYIVVAIILTGMVPLQTLANAHPVAAALEAVGQKDVAAIISLGASLAIISVLVVMQYGQTRIFFSMSRDGLLPKVFSKVHPKFGTPALSTILTGILVAIPAGLIDIAVAAELSNIGTLFAFVLVAGGIMVLRVKDPERPRGFRVAGVWVVAPAAIAICLYLMVSLTRVTWERFFIWMAIGLVVYFLYGMKNSTLGQGHETPTPPGDPETLTPVDKGVNVGGRTFEA